ncbi:SUKH-4 family immunity protein [Streptomyces actuosus]|uniref:SUKH-4 family immunity protein n=1 Tax=Streptomyces actuosus TaxID=1885 RepID=A0ABS2VRW6_STRAS|nr:SUKH-4 family immunity protein [Streptomyces actuosus]MBN0045868.1 SUKH-4 family immunity protein [Streptomyces actuosus]
MSTSTMTPDASELHGPTSAARGRWTPAPGSVAPATRSGLSLDLPPRLLDDAFGRGRIVRFEDFDFPPALTHEPTRRFLRDVGLPEYAPGFALDLDAPLRPLTEYAADEYPDRRVPPLPAGADLRLCLGGLTGGTHAVLDGPTGRVLAWSGSGRAPRPLEADVAALAFTLWQSTRTAARTVAGLDRTPLPAGDVPQADAAPRRRPRPGRRGTRCAAPGRRRQVDGRP